ncbi:methyl-accepting chemotaxis protein McpC [Bacillus luti]|nr:methyl-accepting chemotaxis protein [Bacillus cereus]HDR8328467.1 methyl-accepting chemotaxis protein [Bacillus cereus]HDR8334230.1 methyl-accepting chemotaxis protein [Bacillus cereus]
MRRMRSKLLLCMILILVSSLVLVQGVSYLKLQDTIETSAKEQSEMITSDVMYRMESKLQTHQMNLKAFAEKMKYTDVTWEQINREWETYRNAYPEVSSIYYATEGKQMSSVPFEKMPENFDPTQRPWYKLATKGQGKVKWTDVYKDAQNGKLIVTGVVSVMDESNNVKGVIGVDIALSGVASMIDEKDVGYNGYSYVIDKNGVAIVHPTKAGSSLKGSFETSKIKGFDGTFETENKNKDYYIHYNTTNLMEWTVGVVYEKDKLMKPVKDVTVITTIMLIGSLIVASAISLYFSKRITNPIEILAGQMKEVEKGSLNVKVNIASKDELGILAEQFNRMMDEMRQILGAVKGSVGQLHGYSLQLNDFAKQSVGTSQEIANAMHEVSIGSVRQTEELERITKQTEELAQSIEHIHKSVIFMNELSSQTDSASTKGMETLRSLRNKTNDTVSGVEQVGAVVSQLLDKMKEIEGFLEGIKSISEKTDLLAINANLEAEKALDHGKGFGVIAQEVKSLAEKSTIETQRVQNTIKSIQEEAEQVAGVIEKMKKAQREQEHSVQETEEVFQVITGVSEQLVETIYNLTKKVEEIAEDRKTYLEVVHTVSVASEQAAAAAEEVNASADEQVRAIKKVEETASGLKEASESLEKQVQRFRF